MSFRDNRELKQLDIFRNQERACLREAELRKTAHHEEKGDGTVKGAVIRLAHVHEKGPADEIVENTGDSHSDNGDQTAGEEGFKM